MATVLDAGYRWVYWLGFRIMRAWWGITRPDHYGVMVAVWAEGRVLMLKSSYRASFDFPGGGIDRGETALAAACRELQEEVGVAVPAEAFRFLREIVAWWDNRRDHVSMFELRLSSAPSLRPDGREILSAAFLPPQAALALPVSPFVRAYLESVGVS